MDVLRVSSSGSDNLNNSLEQLRLLDAKNCGKVKLADARRVLSSAPPASLMLFSSKSPDLNSERVVDYENLIAHLSSNRRNSSDPTNSLGTSLHLSSTRSCFSGNDNQSDMRASQRCTSPNKIDAYRHSSLMGSRIIPSADVILPSEFVPGGKTTVPPNSEGRRFYSTSESEEIPRLLQRNEPFYHSTMERSGSPSNPDRSPSTAIADWGNSDRTYLDDGGDYSIARTSKLYNNSFVESNRLNSSLFASNGHISSLSFNEFNGDGEIYRAGGLSGVGNSLSRFDDSRNRSALSRSLSTARARQEASISASVRSSFDTIAALSGCIPSAEELVFKENSDYAHISPAILHAPYGYTDRILKSAAPKQRVHPCRIEDAEETTVDGLLERNWASSESKALHARAYFRARCLPQTVVHSSPTVIRMEADKSSSTNSFEIQQNKEEIVEIIAPSAAPSEELSALLRVRQALKQRDGDKDDLLSPGEVFSVLSQFAPALHADDVGALCATIFRDSRNTSDAVGGRGGGLGVFVESAMEKDRMMEASESMPIVPPNFDDSFVSREEIDQLGQVDQNSVARNLEGLLSPSPRGEGQLNHSRSESEHPLDFSAGLIEIDRRLLDREQNVIVKPPSRGRGGRLTHNPKELIPSAHVSDADDSFLLSGNAPAIPIDGILHFLFNTDVIMGGQKYGSSNSVNFNGQLSASVEHVSDDIEPIGVVPNSHNEFLPNSVNTSTHLTPLGMDLVDSSLNFDLAVSPSAAGYSNIHSRKQALLRRPATSKSIKTPISDRNRWTDSDKKFREFRTFWEAKHGAPAAKELALDAAEPAEGPTWTRAEPLPFKVLHMVTPPPILKSDVPSFNPFPGSFGLISPSARMTPPRNTLHR